MKKSCLLIFLVLALFGHSQKLPFENYGVDRGLSQSQVQAICQDKQHHLWVGTYGGVDRFDGNTFKHFTTQDGLLLGAVNKLFTSSDGTIWLAGFEGLASYNGKGFTNYPFASNLALSVNAIEQDDNGVIWAFGFKPKLLQVKNGKLLDAPLPFEKAVPTCLFKTKDGRLLVNFYQNGLYAFYRNKWEKTNNAPVLAKDEFITRVSEFGNNFIFITNKKNIFKCSNATVTAKGKLDYKNIGDVTIINNEIWLGTHKGIQVYDANNLTWLHNYDAISGLSDNLVNEIFEDCEKNIWIATDADGLFKYSGGAFQQFDKSNGLPGNVVMGLIKAAENIFIGTRENGTVVYDSKAKKIRQLQGDIAIAKTGINCMGADSKGLIYFGTMDSRLMQYNGTNFREIKLDATAKPFINTISCRKDKIWVAAAGGFYVVENGVSKRIRNITGIGLSVLPFDEDKAIAATNSGLYEIDDTVARKVTSDVLARSEISCIYPYKQYYLVGVNHFGFCIWNRQTNGLYFCNTKNGLADNMVFSLFVDSKKHIWAGTATSLHKIRFNEQDKSFTVRQFTKADGYENAESNLNAVAEDNEGKIWIGSTKGVFIYNEADTVGPISKPYTVIQTVDFPGINNLQTDSNQLHLWYGLPKNPVLDYKNNTISFNVRGIYLRNPASVYYSCMLVGYDEEFAKPSKEFYFNYRNLEPGKYVFKVKAITGSGIESENIAEYEFVISTPFTKSKGFLLIVIAGLIMTGVLVQRIISRFRQKRRLKFEELQRKEQDKIRERTAEDFHDELGNRLTRISLLTDILQRKLPAADEENGKLLKQIQENAKALFSGTKDIIWSLTPASDNFKEVIIHIGQFGNELFNDSQVEFSVSGIDEVPWDIVLPPNYNRNLIMISKEILNNALRHSKGTKVWVKISRVNDDVFAIHYSDNGKGFDVKTVKRGNGIGNIQRRAERMHAKIVTESGNAMGTSYTLTLKIPQKGG